MHRVGYAPKMTDGVSSAQSASEVSTAAASLNEEIYDRVAPGYLDYWRYMAAPRFRMDTILRQLADFNPANVVDLGCATGLLLSRVRQARPDVRRIGIDIAPQQVEMARRADPEGEWHVLDLDADSPAIPAPLLGVADAVIAAEIVEHLDHPGRLLAAARSLAAPGGRLILSTQSGPMRETERRVGHTRHFTADEMDGLLWDSGWRPVRIWNAGWPFHDLSKWWANRNPDGSMDRFGEQAYGWSERFICWSLRQLFRLNSNRRGAQLFAVAEAAD